MFKAKAISAIIVTGIFGLAACGGGSSDKNDSTVTTVRQKNAALTFTTLPNVGTLPSKGGNPTSGPTTTAGLATTTSISKTVTTPMPNIGGGAPRPTTTVVLATTTSIVVGIGTTLPCLPPKKPVGPFCK